MGTAVCIYLWMWGSLHDVFASSRPRVIFDCDLRRNRQEAGKATTTSPPPPFCRVRHLNFCKFIKKLPEIT